MHSDRLLVKRAARGCKESLRSLYERHKDHLLTLARGMTGDRNDAEDVVHDVFVAFARALPELRLRSSVRAYLSVSVCNRVRDLLRRRMHQRGDVGPAEPAAEVVAGPAVHAVNAERTERLQAALMALPADQREALLLRARTGLSFNEIGRHQGVGASTARARYRYAVGKLRSQLNSELE